MPHTRRCDHGWRYIFDPSPGPGRVSADTALQTLYKAYGEPEIQRVLTSAGISTNGRGMQPDHEPSIQSLSTASLAGLSASLNRNLTFSPSKRRALRQNTVSCGLVRSDDRSPFPDTPCGSPRRRVSNVICCFGPESAGPGGERITEARELYPRRHGSYTPLVVGA